MAVMDFEYSTGENVAFPIETYGQASHCSTYYDFGICIVTYVFFSV